jgi:Zinc carboxypeptidase
MQPEDTHQDGLIQTPPNAENPWDRLAAVMAIADASSVELLMPFPPHAARKLTGLNIRNSARGTRHVWSATFPWEGKVWLKALGDIRLGALSSVQVLGYLSEPPEVRRQLALEAQARLRRKGVQARVTIRSSYKPALFWLLEEVLPRLRQLGADRLLVQYPVVPNALAGRFLQELYPASSLCERNGISLEMVATQSTEALYEAVAFAGNNQLWQGSCLAPQSTRTLENETVLSPTGWLEVRSDSKHWTRQIPTDGERFWTWYEREVLPQILALSPKAGPFFQCLTVTAQLSEPDLALSIEPERVSMLEALAEEVYFSTLEAFQRHVGAPAGGRGLKVGKIVPIFSENLGQDGQARVTLTLVGEGSLGVKNAQGAVKLVTAEQIIQSAARHSSDSSKQHHEQLYGFQPKASLPNGPLSVQDIWQETQRLGQFPNVSTQVLGYSLEGRPIPMIGTRIDPHIPTLLLTAGQHANEPTGPKAALELLEGWLSNKSINVVGVPLKNPDGLRLYRALRRLHPEHMHHPARYTALGVDVEATQQHEGAALGLVLAQARPHVHLNLHGYPAHEWTRPYTGYAPRGFELWALPMGAMVIVVHDASQKTLARELAASIAADLGSDREIFERTSEALHQRAPHMLKDPFELIDGLPFQFWEREARSLARGLPWQSEEQGTITVITEMPDETVYGGRFDLGVRTQVLIGYSVIRWLESRAKPEKPST